jgi:hypothetical protein
LLALASLCLNDIAIATVQWSSPFSPQAIHVVVGIFCGDGSRVVAVEVPERGTVADLLYFLLLVV